MNFKIIYDPFHGNIELSKIETHLLRTPLINRLHQILQTSTAHYVYTSCKTSRFEHSIGTMNFVGKIFQNGIVNADLSQPYLENKREVTKRLLSDGQNKKFLFDCVKKDGGFERFAILRLFKEKLEFNDYPDILSYDQFKIHLINLMGNDFVHRNVNYKFISDSYNLSNKEQNELEIMYLLLYQSGRIYGLLHDIGHMPFSHLFEYSIDNVGSILSDKPDLNELESIVLENIDAIVKSDGDKLHEVIGQNITRIILRELKQHLNKNVHTIENYIDLLVISVIEILINEIRKGKSGELYSIYNIISGPIDADRLDYIQRDGSLSGIARSTGNIDRIIKMFCLGKLPIEEIVSKDEFSFMPGLQALHDVEEVLQDRFNIYKYLINHHAVKDLINLFQKVIENKLLSELKTQKSFSDKLKVDFLLDSIKIASEIVKDNATDDYKVKMLSFLQLTDFWLLSLLNEEYINLIDSNKGEEFKIESILLKELYENRRNFISVWKRHHEFNEFVYKIADCVIRDWGSLPSSEGKYNFKKKDKGEELISDIINLHNILVEKKEDHESNKNKRQTFIEELMRINEQLKLKSDKKLFTDKIAKAELIKYLNKRIEDYDVHKLMLGLKLIDLIAFLFTGDLWVRDIEKELTNDDYLILVAPVRLKHGSEDLWLIDNKDQKTVRKFENVSIKGLTLRVDSNNATRLYIYFYPKNNHNNLVEIDKIKDTLTDRTANYLKDKFFNYIKQTLIN